MSSEVAPQRAYTLAETAQILRVSLRTLHRLIERGLLRSRKVGRRRIVRVEDLERFLHHGGR